MNLNTQRQQLIKQHNKIVDKYNLQKRKQKCIERINEASFNKYLDKPYNQISDIDRENYEKASNPFHNAWEETQNQQYILEELIFDIESKIHDLEFRNQGWTAYSL